MRERNIFRLIRPSLKSYLHAVLMIRLKLSHTARALTICMEMKRTRHFYFVIMRTHTHVDVIQPSLSPGIITII